MQKKLKLEQFFLVDSLIKNFFRENYLEILNYHKL